MFFDDIKRQPLRVLAVAAHPDDETIGAGGTLIRHVNNGDDLFMCVVTKPYKPDWTEEQINAARKRAKEAANKLQAKEIRFLDYPTVKLNTVPYKELNDALYEVIKEFDPDIIYSPSPNDLNKDHRIVAESVAVAARPLNEYHPKTLVYYEVLSSTEWGRIFLSKSFQPNLYVNIADSLEKKLEIATCYGILMREFPHPRSLEGIKILAHARGMEVGLNVAEAFCITLHLAP